MMAFAQHPDDDDEEYAEFFGAYTVRSAKLRPGQLVEAWETTLSIGIPMRRCVPACTSSIMRIHRPMGVVQ